MVMTILNQDQFVSVCKQLKGKGNNYLTDQVVEAESVLATISEFESDLTALGFQISVDCKAQTEKELKFERVERTMRMRFGSDLSLGFHDTIISESFGEVILHLLVKGCAYEIYQCNLRSGEYGSMYRRCDQQHRTSTCCYEMRDQLKEILKFSKFLATAGILPTN